GQIYTASMFTRSGNTSGTARVVLTWEDENGTPLGSPVMGSPVSFSGDSTYRRASITETAPAGAHFAKVSLLIVASITSHWIDATGAMLSEGPTLQDYFDGNTADDPGRAEYVWSGASNDST